MASVLTSRNRCGIYVAYTSLSFPHRKGLQIINGAWRSQSSRPAHPRPRPLNRPPHQTETSGDEGADSDRFKKRRKREQGFTKSLWWVTAHMSGGKGTSEEYFQSKDLTFTHFLFERPTKTKTQQEHQQKVRTSQRCVCFCQSFQKVKGWNFYRTNMYR